MHSVTNGLRDRGDAALVSGVRGGDVGAFVELVGRHEHAMRRLARILDPLMLCGDLSAEALTVAYPSLAQGHGPAMALRSYLLLLVRNLHRVRSAGLVRPFLGETTVFAARPFSDHPLHPGPDQGVVAAFATLPEGWQAVLWHLDVEHDSPARAGRLLGVPPDAVPLLAARARDAVPDARSGGGLGGGLGGVLARHLLGEHGEEYVDLARAAAAAPPHRCRRVRAVTLPRCPTGPRWPTIARPRPRPASSPR